MAKTVFNRNKVDFTKQPMFFGEDQNTQRYDTFKFPEFDKLNQTMLGYFWRPEEVSLQKDRADYQQFRPEQKHIFTSNLKYQTLLDSVQGRGPSLAFLVCCIVYWDFFETIHSRSYTHIMKNVYPDPSEVLDHILEDDEIIKRAISVTKNYDSYTDAVENFMYKGKGSMTDVKKKLFLAMMNVNILEGLRFYVSFACTFAFGELKLMEGSAKIISLIARDENLHLASTQTLLKLLPKDDPDYIEIAKLEKDYITKMFVDAVDQEKAWADYLFKDGSMIGLNAQLLHDYIEWICCKRMTAIGMKCPYSPGQANPLPWTQKWISGAELQVAPQETEISSYVIGGVKQDVDKDSFSGFKL